MSAKKRGWYNIYSLSCLILAAIVIYIVWYYYIGTEQRDWILFASTYQNNTEHIYISENVEIEENIVAMHAKLIPTIDPFKKLIKPPTSRPSKVPTVHPIDSPTKSPIIVPSKKPTISPFKNTIKSAKNHISENCLFGINKNSSMIWCRQNMDSFGKTPLQIWLSETLNFTNWSDYFKTLFCDYNIDDISTVCSISTKCLKERFKIRNIDHLHKITHSCTLRRLSLDNWNKTVKKLIVLSYATIGDGKLLNNTLMCDMMKINTLNNISIQYMGNTYAKRENALVNKVYFLENKLIELSKIYSKKEADKILILFVDGTDLYISANKEVIIKKWISMNVANYILFSSERFGMFVGRYTRPKWPNSPYIHNKDYKWLNSGGFIGSLSVMYKLVNIDLNYLRNNNDQYIQNDTHKNGVYAILGRDQYWYSLLYFQNYDGDIIHDTNNKQNHHQIVLDYKGEFFMSICQNAVNGKLMGNESGIYYNVTNVKPLIVHFNGYSSMNANTAYNILYINKYLNNLKTTYSNYHMIFNDTIIQNDDIFKKTVSLNQLCPYWFGNSMKRQFTNYGYVTRRKQILC